jgi:hypothetical protein
MEMSTRVTQQHVAMRPDRAGICLIDTSSAVRHLCSDMFSAIGYDLCVFYSPETFVYSGAVATVDLLILGHTRMRLAENKTLRAVGKYRPEIRTIVLGDSQALIHRLSELFQTPSIATVHENSLDRISRLLQTLHLFCDLYPKSEIYQTIRHRSFTETNAADTSMHSGQGLLHGGTVITYGHSLYNSLGMERGRLVLISSSDAALVMKLPDTHYSLKAQE